MPSDGAWVAAHDAGYTGDEARQYAEEVDYQEHLYHEEWLRQEQMAQEEASRKQYILERIDSLTDEDVPPTEEEWATLDNSPGE